MRAGDLGVAGTAGLRYSGFEGKRHGPSTVIGFEFLRDPASETMTFETMRKARSCFRVQNSYSCLASTPSYCALKTTW